MKKIDKIKISKDATIKQALKSKLISRYIVSTDDKEIQKVA